MCFDQHECKAIMSLVNSNNIANTVDLWETQVLVAGTVRCLELVSPVRPRTEIAVGQSIGIGQVNGTNESHPQDRFISRNHFTVECDLDGGIFRDLGSTNGTFLNGRAVREARI